VVRIDDPPRLQTIDRPTQFAGDISKRSRRIVSTGAIQWKIPTIIIYQMESDVKAEPLIIAYSGHEPLFVRISFFHSFL
jgi:hypothetical protein